MNQYKSGTGLVKGKIDNSDYSFEYHYDYNIKETNQLQIIKNQKKILTATISLLQVLPVGVIDNWRSAQSPMTAPDWDLKKCLEILDESPCSFFYYATEIKIFNDNGGLEMTLSNQESISAYSFSAEALLDNPISKTFISPSKTLQLFFKPDNIKIIDQLSTLQVFSDRSSFNPQQSIGLLRNETKDISQELLKFVTSSND